MGRTAAITCQSMESRYRGHRSETSWNQRLVVRAATASQFPEVLA